MCSAVGVGGGEACILKGTGTDTVYSIAQMYFKLIKKCVVFRVKWFAYNMCCHQKKQL